MERNEHPSPHLQGSGLAPDAISSIVFGQPISTSWSTPKIKLETAQKCSAKNELQRFEKLLQCPDLTAEQIQPIQLFTRTKYYMFINVHNAVLEIEVYPALPQAKKSNLKLLATNHERPEGTFFTLEYPSIAEQKYYFQFFEWPRRSGDVPILTVPVNVNKSSQQPAIEGLPLEPPQGRRANKKRKIQQVDSTLIDGTLSLQSFSTPYGESVMEESTEDNFLALLGLGSEPTADPVMPSGPSFIDPHLLGHQFSSDSSAYYSSQAPTALTAAASPKRCGFPREKGLRIEPSHFFNQIANKLVDSNVLVIHGVSGIGKSTLASEYGYDNTRSDFYQFAVWIDCKNDETLLQSFSRIAKYLKIPNEPENFVQATLEALQSSRCLIVYDNCNTLPLDEYFPADPEMCHVIITTQILQADWPLYKLKGAQMTLSNYSNSGLISYILGVVGIQDPTQEMLDAALDIVKEYKSFTLLMALIPQFIRQENLTLPDFVRIYQDQFVQLAPLNISKEDVPLKIVIDSLDGKCKMFLLLLSFMNSLAGIHFFTECAFFIENQHSTTKFSELKRTVAKLSSLSLVEFLDNGQAVKIGHEWIEHYLIRAMTKEDRAFIFNNWGALFRHVILVERCKYEVGDLFAALLPYLPETDTETQIRFLNTATDCLVNWTNPKPPQLYVNIFSFFKDFNLQILIIGGVTWKNEELMLLAVLERFPSEYPEDHLHVLIASFFYARILSEKGQFTEALKLLARCNQHIGKYLHQSHTFCREIFRLYGVALYRCGDYRGAEPILTDLTRYNAQNRKIDDSKCFLAFTKFYLQEVFEARKLLGEFLLETTDRGNRCDLDSVTMKEALAMLLLCEISLNNPFPRVLHSHSDLTLVQQVDHVIDLYRNRTAEFMAEEIVVERKKFFWVSSTRCTTSSLQ